VFASGGKIMLQEMQVNEEQRRRLFLVIGNGRSPDAVLDERTSTAQSYNPARQRAPPDCANQFHEGAAAFRRLRMHEL
jgi:hypothetical protein